MSDIVFMVIFLVEMLIKWVAMGVYRDPPDVGEAVLLHASGTMEKIARSRAPSVVDDDAAKRASAAHSRRPDSASSASALVISASMAVMSAAIFSSSASASSMLLVLMSVPVAIASSAA